MYLVWRIIMAILLYNLFYFLCVGLSYAWMFMQEYGALVSFYSSLVALILLLMIKYYEYQK